MKADIRSCFWLGLSLANLHQRSVHYTPEHCLVNGGCPVFWWKKPFKWAKGIFSGALFTCPGFGCDSVALSRPHLGAQLITAPWQGGRLFGARLQLGHPHVGFRKKGAGSKNNYLRDQKEIIDTRIKKKIFTGSKTNYLAWGC